MLNSYPPATLFGTHVRKVTSSIVDQEYEISVWLPPDYDDAPEKTYPVLYVTDADAAFGMAAHMTWMLVDGQNVPPMIVVGIGWHIQSLNDWLLRRNRDLLPTAVEWAPGSTDGGAATFLSFIETELIPLITANYRTDPTRQFLWGHSFGGVFALYALLQKPGLFSGIISGSPLIAVSPSEFYDMEKALAESGKPVPAKVYFAFGSSEIPDIKAFEEFYRTMVSRNYVGLTLKYQLLDGETHESVIARLFITGLRAMFMT